MNNTEMLALTDGVGAQETVGLEEQNEMTATIEGAQGGKMEEVQEQSNAAGAKQRPLWKLFATVLPPELRLEIHKHVLIVGHLFPYRKTHFLPSTRDGLRFRHPPLGWIHALASMDKKIKEQGIKAVGQDEQGGSAMAHLRSEAEGILYGSNTIVLDGDSCVRFLEDACLSLNPWDRCKSIKSIQLNIWDRLSDQQYRDIVRSTQPKNGLGGWQRTKQNHDLAMQQLVDGLWKKAFECIRPLPQLRSLVVHLRHAACHHGCCRLAKDLVTKHLHFEASEALQELSLVGVLDRREKRVLGRIICEQVRREVPGKAGVWVMLKSQKESAAWTVFE